MGLYFRVRKLTCKGEAGDMVIIRTAILIASLFLAGCDSGKEIDGLKGDVAANKQQIVALKVELALVKDRLMALESTQIKSVSSNGPQPLTESQIEILKKTISQCVRFVKGSAPKGEFKDEVYAKFDAFYNPATGRVQNNNQYVDQSALYTFNKCMAEHGFPLS
jgi:outer membrane murein-binding lipoprotein Lpp